MECHKCKWRDDPNRLERCLACQLPDSSYPMRVANHAAVYADASPGFEDSFKAEEIEERDGVTDLSQDDEDKIVAALSTFAGLDEIEALLAQHLLRGRSLASFDEILRNVAAFVLRRNAVAHFSAGRSRSFAWTRAKKVIKSFAPFRAIVPETGQKNKGGGKRPKRKQEYIQEELL